MTTDGNNAFQVLRCLYFNEHSQRHELEFCSMVVPADQLPATAVEFINRILLKGQLS